MQKTQIYEAKRFFGDNKTVNDCKKNYGSTPKSKPEYFIN
jgi:hypothetical protein